MTHARFSIKALGLCLVVLGMTAAMAASAQGSWLVGTPAVTLVGEKPVKAKAHTEFILSVPAKNLKKLCTTVTAGAGSAIKAVPLGFILLVLNFTNCQTLVNDVVQVNCKPAEPVTMRAKGQLILHNGEEYILLSGDEESSPGVFRFGRLDFPATCALPDTNDTGSLVLECLTAALSTSGNCLEHTVSHLVQEAPAALFPSDSLLYGVSPAFMSGIFNLELSSGEAWSGHV